MKAQKTTKHNQVKEHLKTKRTISSLDAIRLYYATRLSAIIFNLRKSGWDIVTIPKTIKDRNNQNCTYALYKLISTPEESVLQQKYKKAIMQSGKKTDKKK